MKKTIGISIPCFNEEENVVLLCETIIQIFEEQLSEYHYLIQFIDNCSTDRTQQLLEGLCSKYQGTVRAIFNQENYRWKSSAHGFLNTDGDCVIILAADFEEPPELIPVMVREWAEHGYKVVAGIKEGTNESSTMAFFRKTYYKINSLLAEYSFIDGFSGFGLYDREFVELYRQYYDEETVFRNFVARYGWGIKTVPFVKKARTKGYSKHNIFSLFNDFFRTLADGSYVGIRITTFLGFILSVMSIFGGILYFIFKLLYWHALSAGMAPLIIGMFLLGGIQLFVLGMIGEYIIKLDLRLTPKQIVHERVRIGFACVTKEGRTEE